MGMDRYDYDLPAAAVAQVPVEPRDAARLLVALAAGSPPAHRHVIDLPDLLRPGDLLVVNESRVRPARLRLRRPTGGAVEVMLLEREGEAWSALVRPSRRVRPGSRLPLDEGVEVEVGEELPGGTRRVRLVVAGDDGGGRPDDETVVARYGEVPLPPYVRVPLADPERYQTVYATRPGSAAAPTAGLHLTPEVLARCRARGIGVVSVELEVGLDTFRPITADRPEDHEMHSERYRVPPETMAACERADRVVAVGTTTVRALESAACGPLEGRTRLFVQGDFEFRVVDVLLTNFHQPRSSLLLLLAAFYGDRWRDLYRAALDAGYRFLSFGDAMLVARAAGRR